MAEPAQVLLAVPFSPLSSSLDPLSCDRSQRNPGRCPLGLLPCQARLASPGLPASLLWGYQECVPLGRGADAAMACEHTSAVNGWGNQKCSQPPFASIPAKQPGHVIPYDGLVLRLTDALGWCKALWQGLSFWPIRTRVSALPLPPAQHAAKATLPLPPDTQLVSKPRPCNSGLLTYPSAASSGQGCSGWGRQGRRHKRVKVEGPEGPGRKGKKAVSLVGGWEGRKPRRGFILRGQSSGDVGARAAGNGHFCWPLPTS